LNNVLDVNGSKNDELEEIGDIIFCCVNIARKLEIDPEEALRFCNRKFESRFKYIQQQLDLNCVSIENSSFQELNELWDQAKIAESELKLK
ncbi:MAG: nucleoside triphosphate pyrophosphohydrolase, partial [Pseudomonadota bacterium]